MECRGIWKRDVMVADIEELEILDASEVHARRLNEKEVLRQKKGEHLKFPILNGTAKLCGRDHEVRESTPRREQPVMNQDLREKLQGNSERSQPTETQDDAEARNDFWSLEGDYRHHVEPRVQLHVPKEESFPIPQKYIDVTRTAHTNLDVKQEKRIDDYGNIDGSRDLSDPWTGFTQFTLLEEKPPDGYVVRGEIDEKAAYIQARSFMARALEVNGKACQAEGEAKMV